MKHIKERSEFLNESYKRTSNKYKTQNVEWDDIEPGDYELTDDEVKKHVTNEALNENATIALKSIDVQELKVGDLISDGYDQTNSLVKVLSISKRSSTKYDIESEVVWLKPNRTVGKNEKLGDKVAFTVDTTLRDKKHKDISIATNFNESVTEAKSKYEIEVSVRTAKLANEILRDNRNLNYTTDGSNCFIFRNRSEYDEALDILSAGGVEIDTRLINGCIF
jgi:Tfp pilus assembly protein PilZ